MLDNLLENIFKRDKIRYNLLLELFRRTDADPTMYLDLKAIGSDLKIDRTEIGKAFHYLIDDGLVESAGGGYIVTISHYGIKMIESFIRKIDFDNNSNFDQTELYQLRIILDEVKEQIGKLQLGQEVIFNQIDDAFEKSKEKTKPEWKDYFENQIRDWSAQKLIDYSAQLLILNLIQGIKVNP